MKKFLVMLLIGGFMLSTVIGCTSTPTTKKETPAPAGDTTKDKGKDGK